MNKKIVFYLMALAIMAAYIALVASIRWSDNTPPRISLAKPFTLVGPETPLSIHIEDDGTGLREVSVRLVQNLEQYTLAEEQFPSHGFLSLKTGTQHTYDLNIVPFNEAIPKRRGSATLIITARDYSWRGFFEGNWVRLNQDFTVKFTPPKLELLSVPLPMTQGGAGVVFFRTSDDAKTFGVKIDEAFFPGHPTPGKEYNYFSLVAFPHNLPAKTPVQLVADDGLGNKAVQTVDIKIIPKKWRTRNINISDRFIQRTVLPIIAQTPEIEDQGNPLQNFLSVNNVCLLYTSPSPRDATLSGMPASA